VTADPFAISNGPTVYPVDDLPAQTYKGQGRPSIYSERLAYIINQIEFNDVSPDVWWVLNTFDTKRGAQSAVKRFRAGQIQAPKDYTMEMATRFEESSSTLYVKVTHNP
jgi:hypothetical protein